ncbi:MAG: AraC family transcriptional regulator [Lachnospiraceae bacterium]|jgi:AraC-like DNA-binding protein|nr:AraC family transcriptional regulator [Lachnospiraceae bacterium]
MGKTSYYLEVTEAAKNYIELNIKNGITSEETAKFSNYSLKQLNRIFYLVTGLTVCEFIRWKKLTEALFELKYNDELIINIAYKYGYESHEAFTRAFKDNFSVTPGEYKKTKKEITAKNWHINQFIHKTAHDFLNKNYHKRENVESWIITKPDRIWVSLRRNIENIHPAKFYDLCGMEGIMDKADQIPNVLMAGGAYLPGYNDDSRVCFGVEVDENYPMELINEFEIYNIPQCKYIVFNCPSYPIENHGDVIYSTWYAQKDFDIEANGLKWAMDKAPIFEDDSPESTGYTLWFPVTEK